MKNFQGRAFEWGTVFSWLAVVISVQLLAPSSFLYATSRALWEEEKSTIALFQKAQRSVVYITTVVLQEDIFSFDIMEIPAGAGSGFVWDDKGHIVTNFHVIGSASAASITLNDRSQWKARLVGVAPDQDLAVLKIDAPASRLVPIPVGASGDLQVGQKVFAIGNPFGLDQTLTTGIISALGREIQALTGRKIHGVIQTDAAINPGNSGGPLLDSSGQLIGVNTAIYSPSGASAGIGFAVPVDIVARVVPQLIQHGRVIRPALGISILDDRIAQQLGVSGVVITDMRRGGAAERAGLKAVRRNRYGDVLLGDIIVGINGRKVESSNDLYDLLEYLPVGKTVPLDILRDRRRLRVNITLEGPR